VQACAGFSKARSGANRAELQRILSKAGINIQAPPSYRADIQRLSKYSRETIRSLASLANISVGGTVSIKIHRQSTSALLTTAETSSILVIGEPGAGKSGALHDLAVALQAAGRDVFVLAADRIQSSSIAALKGELQLEHDLLDVFDNWHGSGQAFFITDALDAARSDHAGKMLRELIGRALQSGGRWKVVASVRKFDLRYNRDLRALFSGEAPEGYRDPGFVQISHFLIPTLNDTELAEVGAQSQPMQHLIEKVRSGRNTDLQALIRVPFNLRLLAWISTGKSSTK